MKVAAWPDHGTARPWRNEIRTFLVDAREGFSPSMAQLLDVGRIHARSLEAVRDMRMDAPPRPLRKDTDLTIGELLSPELSTDALIARLRG